MNEQFTKYKPTIDKYGNVVFRKQVFIVLLIVSAVLILSLLQSRSYLNPTRNETRYQEEVLKIKYSTIDQAVIDEISATLNDKTIEVDPNFEPGRNNPFSE